MNGILNSELSCCGERNIWMGLMGICVFKTFVLQIPGRETRKSSQNGLRRPSTTLIIKAVPKISVLFCLTK